MKNELEELRISFKMINYERNFNKDEILIFHLIMYDDDWLDVLCVQDKFILLERVKNAGGLMSDKLKNEFVYKIEKGIRKEKIMKLKKKLNYEK